MSTLVLEEDAVIAYARGVEGRPGGQVGGGSRCLVQVTPCKEILQFLLGLSSTRPGWNAWAEHSFALCAAMSGTGGKH